MESLCEYGGSNSQKFEVWVKYVKKMNVDILNQFFDLEIVGFDIKIMSLG